MIFGSQDDQQNTDVTPAGAPAGSSFIVGAAAPSDDMAMPAAQADDTTTVAPDGLDDGASAVPTAEPGPVSGPLGDVGLGDEGVDPAPTDDLPIMQPQPDELDETPGEPVLAQSQDDDLLVLTQQALGDLGPLIDHLDQSPEEKFRTTMMMIQSTDNQALLKEAYAAAQAIPDDKVRAQALLDVVNEINYFTQHAPADQE